MKCLICSKEVENIYPEEDRFNTCWRGGMVSKVYAGYGSNKDGDIYFIALCDGCVHDKVRDGVIEYLGDYLTDLL